MPLLSYRCPVCKKEIEELVKVGEEPPKCPDCGAQTERSYTGKVLQQGKPSLCTHHCATCSGCK